MTMSEKHETYYESHKDALTKAMRENLLKRKSQKRLKEEKKEADKK